MTEDWVECPALGPGWKRREAFRKSGATCGRTDTYYQSPTGEKFRSKIELSRFLGPSRDLGNFDFKNGLEHSGPPKTRKGPKWRPPAGHPPEPPPELPPAPEEQVEEAEAVEALPPPAEAPPSPAPSPPPPAEAPAPAPPPLRLSRRTRKRPPPEPPQDRVVACCASCQSIFPGVTLPSQRRCRWLCPECRAQRRDFNREQRFFKRVGCGACQACRIPEDCGICSACARPTPPPARPPKCLLRRCLRIVKKGLGCGSCSGCLATEDCGTCCICLRRLKPGLKRQWRCLRRRCLRPKRSGVTKKTTYSPRKLTVKWKPPVEREPSATPSTRHRKQLNKVKEKKKPGRPPKHAGARGGGGDKEHPTRGAEKGPGPPLGPPLHLTPFREETGPLPRLEDPRLGLLIASAPRLKTTPPEPSVAPGPPHPGDLGVLIAATPRVKQEQPQPSASLVPVPPRLPPAQLVVLDESEEEEEEMGSRVPLPLPPAPPCWPGAFLAELAEIPLPAHWGVVGGDEDEGSTPTSPSSTPSPLAPSPPPPGLRLVQRSPRSPMAATVVVLAPGLAFRVLVARQRPVPPGHEVLTRRPPRLRSVDDLVELLCDLEAYRPCPGPPGEAPRPPAPRCQVLVPGGRCCRPCLLLGGGGD
ncbi:methyl-CpG-binding domain protein 1 isoform X2 [Falco rusticolus]|uniref:methyl-CpG-binding domain protein 1 isoform X2 n=1 Tax=Falco rusticolus TaxID=120794 RepID=UPI0018869A8B|nr:methyl-CpG-binding domain protein 1 isoform X2 [Falco rusticolus]